ncbi:MAG: hypothetical protein ACRD6X_17740, partial [Pyrinomonadaceae bacterium]
MNIPRGKSFLLIIILAVFFGVSAQDPASDAEVVAKVVNVAVEPKSPKDEPVKKADLLSSEGPILARIGVQTVDTVPISLEEAIRRALLNNNNIELTRDDVRFQETQIRSIGGAYDPVFSITPTYTRNSTTGSAATNDFNVNSRL